MLFPIVAILFYTPTSGTQGIPLLHIFTDTCQFLICFVLILAILMGVKFSVLLINVQLETLPGSRVQEQPVTQKLLSSPLCRYALHLPTISVLDLVALLLKLLLYISLFFRLHSLRIMFQIHLSYHCISRLLKSIHWHEYSATCPFI